MSIYLYIILAEFSPSESESPGTCNLTFDMVMTYVIVFYEKRAKFKLLD
jgi:hypothetical protein